MAEAYVGEIRIFAGNFPPRGWALCNGQLLPIAQNTALFSLIGTYYGGNGVTTFALPDFQARAPMHQGTGPGLTTRVIGETGGAATVTLITSEIPQHTHSANADGASSANKTAVPTNATWAPSSNRDKQYGVSTTAPNVTMAPTAIGLAGGNQPHANMPPYLALNFIIALQGIFPARN